MAYFLQGYLPGDWISKLAFFEVLIWVAMFSLIFLGKHEDKTQINRLTAELAERDAEIAALKPQPASEAAEGDAEVGAASGQNLAVLATMGKG